MLNWYTVDIRKDYTADCRCIKFEPNEYIENSKEIRQLSGPVSFYRLKAITQNLDPNTSLYSATIISIPDFNVKNVMLIISNIIKKDIHLLKNQLNKPLL
jgi:hypothetical protein